MLKDVFISIFLSFFISAFLCPVVIPFLRRMKLGQQVRNDGPKEHLKKMGTPTMGGLVILFSVLLTSLLFIQNYPQMIPVLFVTLGFGFIGFMDDYLKIVLKRSEGLKPYQKLAGQVLIAGVFAYYLVTRIPDVDTIILPFSGGKTITLGPWFLPFYFMVTLGTDNGVNFSDGLDGLCASVTMLVAVFFTVIAIGENSHIEPLTGAVAGSLLGFLLFNVYPAKVFMGDTGSLALGGFVSSVAFTLRMPVFIALVGVIYFAEVLSVILQVAFFKLTGGRRLFRMAPLHHHFELGGWSETRVVAIFTIITGVCCLLGFLGM